MTAPTVTFSGGNGSGAAATASISADGRVVSILVTNPGSGYTGTPTATLSQPAPGGVGSSIRFNNDLSNNRILNLDGNRTVGRMILGDLSGTSIYTLAQGAGNGSLTFDNNGNGGGAFFNKFQGGQDVISAPIELDDRLNVRITTQRLTLSNTITGNGNTLTSYGNGILSITGDNTNSDFNLWLWNKGAGNANPQVELGATIGNAVGGNIIIGNASRGTSGHAVLQLLQNRTNLDQIKDSSTILFDSYTGSGRNNYFKLMGGDETVGNIVDLGSLAVIENREGEGVTTAAKLTLANDLDSYVSGFIRDNTGNNLSQADADGSAGTRGLALRKEGSGTLSLANANISFSGGLEVAEGTVRLTRTTNFRSDIANEGTVIFDTGTLGLTGVWNFTKTFTDPDGAGSLREPVPQNLIVSGSGDVEKTGQGILNLSGGMTENQNIGGTLTVRNGTLNLSGAGAGTVIGEGLIVAGDSGLNRNVNLLGRTTIDGGIDATGRYNNVGSTMRIKGTVFTGGDQETSFFQDGIATVNGPIKLNFMSLVLESDVSIAKTSGGGTSNSNKVNVTNSSSIVVGMRVTGNGVPAGTLVTAIDPVTRVVTLSNNATIGGNTALSFDYSSHSDGVINGNVTGLTVIGRPNVITSTASNNGRLILRNTGFSNNNNRLPDSTPIFLKGGAIDLINDGTTNAFTERLGALTISQGQAQITNFQAGTGGTSLLRFDSLTRNYGSTVEFAGRQTNADGSISTVTNALGTSTRNRILFDTPVPMVDGIIGGWAWADNEFVKYGANGVTQLVAADYMITTNAANNQTAWRSDKNVKLNLTQTLTINARRSVNSLNFQSALDVAAVSRAITLSANSILSIDSGGLLANQGNHTITGTGATGYLTVATPVNTLAELNVILGTNTSATGAISASSFTLNTAIRDFYLALTSGVTMAANSTIMNVPANTATVLKVGMTVSHINLPAGTVIMAVDPNAAGATAITLNNAPVSGALGTVNVSRPVIIRGGSVGLTKSGPGVLVMSSTLENDYSGPTIINNGTLRLRANSNLGKAPSSFVANHLQLNGGTLQFGQDAKNGTVNVPYPDFNYEIIDGNRGLTFGEAGGRLEVGHLNPNPLSTNAANVSVVPEVNVTITNPIYAEGVVELAVRSNAVVQAFNTLTLGTASSNNYYGGGIKTEGLFDGIITINGTNTINGLLMEGGRVTLANNNNLSGSIRILSGQLTLSGANTYNGLPNFSEPIIIGAGTVTLGRNNSLGTAGFKVSMADNAQLRFFGTDQTILSFSGSTLFGATSTLSTISNGFSRPQGAPVSQNRPSTLTVDLAVNEIFNGRLSNGGSSVLNLTKTGDGRLSLTNIDSDFSGFVNIQSGVLDVTSINFSSGQSALGRGVTGAASEIRINGGALSFSARGQQYTNRSFSIGTGVDAATLVANGLNQAARVILGADFTIEAGTPFEERFVSEPIGFIGSGSRTLTLSGVNIGDNELQLQLGDKSLTEQTSMLKTGPGVWVLGKAGTFSGELTVQEGILAIAANNVAGTTSIPTTVDFNAGTFTGDMPNGVEVSFPRFVQTVLPVGLLTDKRYYVVQSTGSTFKVSATPGGTAITMTSAGQNVTFVPNIQPIASTVADSTTERFTGNLPNGTAVVFSVQIPTALPVSGATNGVLPGGISAYETYYVRDATGTDFRISRTIGGSAVLLNNDGVGPLYYTATLIGNTSSGINLVGGRLDLRNVDYITPETITFQGGALSLPRNTTATWAGNFEVQANTTITVGANSELVLDGNLLGTRAITQLGDGTIRLRGETIMMSQPGVPTGTMDNNRRSFSVQAGTLILDYSENNNSKLVDNATLVLGGGRRGGVLRLQGGNHEEIVGALSLSSGANQIYRDSGTSIVRLNNVTRAEGASLYFDLGRIATVDILNVNNILGGWAIIRDATVQASWILPGTTSKKFRAFPDSDIMGLFPLNQGAHYLSNGTPVALSTNGTLPAPLVPGQTYYVTSSTVNTFKLSTTPFGLPIDLTDSGSVGAEHQVYTNSPIKRQGPAALVFTADADNYFGAQGNNVFQIQIQNSGAPGAITSQVSGPALPTPANPRIYTLITTTSSSSANAISAFVNSDINAIGYFSVATSGSDNTLDNNSYGPVFLNGGSNDNGNQELTWARNSSNTADGLVQANTNFVNNIWNRNSNTNVTNSFERVDGGTTYTLRYATNTPTIMNLLHDEGDEKVHTLQTGAILVSPTVGANDSSIVGNGLLTTNNEGNLRNFVIHQYNELGDLVIGARLIDRAPFAPLKHKGRLTSGNRRILTGLDRTDDLLVGATVAFASNATSFGPAPGTSTPNTNSAVIESIDPDGHTVVLDRETLVNDSRQAMVFTVGGNTITRVASHQSLTTQNRILGVVVTNSQGVETISTSDIYVGMPISGEGIPAGAIVDLIVNDADIRINTNHFFIDIQSEFTLTPSIGLEKLGGGTLVLSGDNTYSGVTFLADGVLRATKLTDAGVAGSLGAATAVAANLNFNGGTLQYVGENSSTNRSFTVTDFARINVGHEKTTSIFSGDISVTGTIGATDRLEKTGSGTLEMRGNSSLNEFKVDEGKLRVQVVDRNASPATFSASNLGGGSLAILRLSGGTLEVRGAQEGNSTVTFGGSLFVEEGASEVRATSVKGYNPNNLSDVGVATTGRTTTLNLMGGEETTSVVRSSGGTVRFVEAPEAGAGAANIFLNTFTFDRAEVLPWAVYQDLTNLATPGVNNFASVSLLNGAVVSADSQSLYDLGDFFMNANNWGTEEPGFSIDASEGGRIEVDLENGVSSAMGSTQLTVSPVLATEFNRLLVGMSVFGPGMPAGTKIVSLNVNNFTIVLNNAATVSTSGGTYLFTRDRTFFGTLTADREVNTIRYFSGEESTITIDTGNTLKLTAGAILVGANVRGGAKNILGDGNITGVATSGEGSDLIVHNYNPVAPFTIGANIVDNVVQLQFGSGSNAQGVASVFVGQANMSVAASAFALFNLIHPGMEVTGPGIAAGTYVIASDAVQDQILLSQPATSTEENAIFSFRSRTSFVQSGTGTTVLSGTNVYTGDTFVHGGVLRLNSVGAVPGGIDSTAPLGASSHIIVKDGVIGLGSGNFTRSLGTADNQIEFKGSGGFAAYGADRTVNFGDEPQIKRLRFGNDGFVNDGSSLIFGASDATHKVTLLNPIDLGSFSQAVRVNNGPADIEGELAGSLSGLGKLIKFGQGSLRLSGQNAHQGGIEIAEGRLVIANATNAMGTGTTALGISSTNTSQSAALELSVEGGIVNNALKVGNTNSRGATWVARGTTDSSASGNLGSHASSAVVNGNPAIAYYDATNGDLKYVRAADARGKSWAAPITLASRGDVGKFPSLSIINGFPAVSFYDETNGTLCYIQSTDISGVFWRNPIIADSNSVNAVAVQSDGKVIAGGTFTEFDGVAKTRLVRLSATGVLETGFTTTVDGEVRQIVVQSDGKIIIAGNFEKVNGTTRNNIARLLTTGALDTGYNPNADNTIRTLVLDPNGDLLVGGLFTNIGGSGRSRLARLSSATGLADAFNPNVNGEVHAIAVEQDGSILLGGSFTAVGGATRNRIARVNSAGTVQSFNPNANSEVRGIVVNADGTIYVGGLFANLLGTNGTASSTRNRLARLLPDGNVDKTFSIELNAEVRDLRQLSNGKVIALGPFSTVGKDALAMSFMTCLNPDGSVDASFVPDPNYEVRSLVEQTDGKLVIGGDFSNVGGLTQHWVGRLNADGSGDASFLRNVDDRGQYTSMISVGGIPAIAYYDFVNGDLRYIRASDVNGTNWASSIPLATTGNVGAGTSMEIVNIGGDLIVKNTDNNTVTIPTSGGVALNGVPAIAFHDESSGALKYIISNNATGTDWSAPVIIQNGVSAANHLSLELVNGFPAIAYFNGASGDLMYAQATNVSGVDHHLRDAGTGAVLTIAINALNYTPEWSTPQVIDSVGVVGQYPSLTVVNGQPTTSTGSPAISYYDVTNGDLKYVRSNNANGLPTGNAEDPPAWGTPVTVQSTGNVGANTTLVMTDGVPGIVYQDVGNGNMKFIHLSDATGYSQFTFTGDTTLNGSVILDGSLLFAPDAGKTVTLNGGISGQGALRLISEGSLVINSSGNNFGSGLGANGDAPVVIRTGNLLLGSNTALGSSRIDLGDSVHAIIKRDINGNPVSSSPLIITVERATTGASLTSLKGRFDPLHNGLFSLAGGPGAFVEIDTTIDGRTYSVADVGTLILVKDELANPAWNGVYRISYNSGIQPDGTMNLVRATEMDELVEFAYGIQVRVTNGTDAGKAYFLASYVTDMNTSAVHWTRDAADANLSLRANVSGLNLANPIHINAREGVGSMSLGAVSTLTSGTVTFSGPITLQDNQPRVAESQSLNLDSSITSGFGVQFTGVISEERGVASSDSGGPLPADSLALVKTGNGVVTLRGANTFHGGVTVNQGTLLVMNTTGSATGSGLVTVNSGAVLGGTGMIGGSVELIGSGTAVNSRATLRLGDPSSNALAEETLTIGGALTVGPNAVVEFTLGATNMTRLAANTVNITPTGRLIVTLDPGFDLAPRIGTELGEFKIMDVATINFTGGSGLPLSQYLRLPGAYLWDTNDFLTQGIIRVVGQTQAVAIATNPVSRTVNPWTQVDFTIVVSGSPDFVYQWQKSVGGSPFENVGPETRSTSTTNTFTLPSVTEADEGAYRVVVTNGEGAFTASSTPVFLSVNDLPAIVQQPTPQTANPGASATFSVTVSGPGPYEFQWRRGTTNIPNDPRFVVVSTGQTSQLTISDLVEADDRLDYNVIVSNTAGPAPASNFVRLAVNDPIVVTTPPLNITVSNGDPAAFTVAVSGTGPFTYQWQRDFGSGFEDVLGATNQSFTIPEVLLADNEQRVRVIVTNVVGSVTSAAATFTVLDGFPSVLLNPLSYTKLEGDTLVLTARVGGAQNGRKLLWKRNRGGIRLGPNTYAGVTSMISVVEELQEDGSVISTLTITNITTRLSGEFTLEARNVNGKNSTAVGQGQVVVVNNPGLVVPAEVNKTASMTVTATGPRGATILYEWKKNGADIPVNDTRFSGVNTKTLKIASLTTADSATYTCVVTGPGATPADNTVIGGTHHLKIFTEAPALITPITFPPAMVGAEFSFQIPVNPLATKTPSRYAASGLPSGLKLDTKTGLISGRPRTSKQGGYPVTITVSNSKGKSVGVPVPSQNIQMLNVQAIPTGAVGIFAGWIPRDEGLNDNMGGRFDLTTTALGAFTGRVTLGRTVLPFKGVLDLDPALVNPARPSATISVNRKGGLSPLTLSFNLDAPNNRIGIATLTDNVMATPLTFSGWRYVWSKLLAPATKFLGYHTFALMPPDGAADDIPQGDSYAAFTVLEDGKLSLVGKTADGQSITGGQFVGPTGEILIFQTLYTTTPRGSLLGQIKLNALDDSIFEDNTISSVPATAPTWNRPEDRRRTNRVYPAGFGPITLTATGGAYVDPTPPKPDPLLPPPPLVDLILGIPDTGSRNPMNAKIEFSDDGLDIDTGDPSLPSSRVGDNYLGIITGNLFVYPVINVATTRVSVTPKTGMFRGTFKTREIDETFGNSLGFLERPTTFQGVIVKTGAGLRGMGYFLLPKYPKVEGVETLKNTLILSNQVLLSPRN